MEKLSEASRAAFAAALVESVWDEAIYALDPDGIILACNEGSEIITGHPRDEVRGKHISVVYTEEEVRLGIPGRELREAMRGGRVVREGWQARRDGTRFWANTSTALLKSQDGGALGFSRITRDLTERMLAEEALRDSEAKFSGIVTIASDAIVTVDETMSIILFNKGAEEVFGYTAREALGSHLNILLPERYHGAHFQHVHAFGAGHSPARRMGERQEIHARRKDGSEFRAEASISKIEVGGRRLFTAVLRDVTERIEHEREIEQLLQREQQLRERAEGAVKGRDEVLRIVAHDLGNSLSGVLITSSALLRTLKDEGGVRDAVLNIRHAAEQMQRLRQDLLDVASIEAGHLSVVFAATQPRELLEETAAQLAPLAQEKGVALRVDAPDDLPLVRADRDRMLQVLGNLVGNAVKFTPPGGEVRVRAVPAEGTVRMSVSDTGPGVPAEHRSHVFDRFWQAREHRRGGAGLGLAIARGIVEAHGGRIWLEEAKGGGAMFVVELPAEGIGNRD
jgi:PAS domain S-box-containing protein